MITHSKKEHYSLVLRLLRAQEPMIEGDPVSLKLFVEAVEAASAAISKAERTHPHPFPGKED